MIASSRPTGGADASLPLPGSCPGERIGLSGLGGAAMRARGTGHPLASAERCSLRVNAAAESLGDVAVKEPLLDEKRRFAWNAAVFDLSALVPLPWRSNLDLLRLVARSVWHAVAS
jgi:hypothetical protein